VAPAPAASSSLTCFDEFVFHLSPSWAGLAGPLRGRGRRSGCRDGYFDRESTRRSLVSPKFASVSRPRSSRSSVCPRCVSPTRRAAFLRGDRFSAAEAARIGLINKAVVASELDNEIDSVVNDLLAGEPHALAVGENNSRSRFHRCPEEGGVRLDGAALGATGSRATRHERHDRVLGRNAPLRGSRRSSATDALKAQRAVTRVREPARLR